MTEDEVVVRVLSSRESNGPAIELPADEGVATEWAVEAPVVRRVWLTVSDPVRVSVWVSDRLSNAPVISLPMLVFVAVVSEAASDTAVCVLFSVRDRLVEVAVADPT